MALLYLANGRVNTVSQLINGIRAVAICLDSATPLATNLDLIKEAIEASTAELSQKPPPSYPISPKTPSSQSPKTKTNAKSSYAKNKNASTSRTTWNSPQLEHPKISLQTYTEALRRSCPPEPPNNTKHRAVLAKEAMMRRQILMDGIETSQSDSTTLTPKLLVAKANLAIDLMENRDHDTSSDKPKEAKIVSAKILGNKGVVLETANEETATWLRRHTKDFAAGMGSQAALKERSLHLVVEFVPATLNDQLPNLLQAIEADNQLKSGMLISARWMRAPGNWRPDQKSAHAILTTNDIPTANSILKNGLVIEGCRLQARKLEEKDASNARRFPPSTPQRTAKKSPTGAQTAPALTP